MNFDITTPPASEPVGLAELKSHLRIDSDDENGTIESYSAAARGLLETQMRRAFITQTITLKLDAFPGDGIIRLPRSPAQAITSVAYVDTDGASQTFNSSKYVLDTASEPARLVPAYDEDWPDTREENNAVTVVYTAGYGDAYTDVPAEVKLAIRLLAGSYFEQREAITTQTWQIAPLGIKALVAAYTIPEVY